MSLQHKRAILVTLVAASATIASTFSSARADLVNEYKADRDNEAAIINKTESIRAQFTHNIPNLGGYPIRIRDQELYHLTCIDHGLVPRWEKLGVLGESFRFKLSGKVPLCFESRKGSTYEVQIVEDPAQRSVGIRGCGRSGRSIHTRYTVYYKDVGPHYDTYGVLEKPEAVQKGPLCAQPGGEDYSEASLYVGMTEMYMYFLYPGGKQ